MNENTPKKQVNQKEPTEEKLVTPDSESSEEKKARKLPVGIPERSKFADGSFKEWQWLGETRENPEWRMICRHIGVDPDSGEAASYVHDIAEIGERVFNWLQDTDSDKVYKFVRQLMRRTPANGSHILNLKRQLQLLWEESKNG